MIHVGEMSWEGRPVEIERGLGISGSGMGMGSKPRLAHGGALWGTGCWITELGDACTILEVSFKKNH